jgi:WASH complex subunit strumpellin
VLLTSKLKSIPSKLNKSDLKEYAQYEERQEMAKLTNSIAVFTESILNVESYLLGVIEVQPKELLDQGIRKELLGLIHRILDKALYFSPKANSVEDFTKRLSKLADDLSAFRQSVEYIQDFINAYGNKMFIEEFDRLMACYIDMEVACLLTKKLTFEELSYDEDIPMPDERSLPFGVINFTGRLLKQVLLMTDNRNTTYIEATLGFYDSKTGAETFNMKTISLLSRCIGNSGLNGLDTLLAHSIAIQLKLITKLITKEMNDENRTSIHQQLQQIKVLTSFNENYEKIYQSFKKQFKSLIA